MIESSGVRHADSTEFETVAVLGGAVLSKSLGLSNDGLFRVCSSRRQRRRHRYRSVKRTCEAVNRPSVPYFPTKPRKWSIASFNIRVSITATVMTNLRLSEFVPKAAICLEENGFTSRLSHIFLKFGKRSSREMVTVSSLAFAGVTFTSSRTPSVSLIRWRLQPLFPL